MLYLVTIHDRAIFRNSSHSAVRRFTRARDRCGRRQGGGEETGVVEEEENTAVAATGSMIIINVVTNRPPISRVIDHTSCVYSKFVSPLVRSHPLFRSFPRSPAALDDYLSASHLSSPVSDPRRVDAKFPPRSDVIIGYRKLERESPERKILAKNL